MALPPQTRTVGTFGLTPEAARVVSWHNRHPLAVRIRADHVVGFGWVLLPFTGAQARPRESADHGAEPHVTLRERAQQRSAQDELRDVSQESRRFHRADIGPAFSEQLLPGIPAGELATFALCQADVQSLPPEAGPRREAQVDAALAQHELVWLHLRSAAIEVGARRVRVVLGAKDGQAVLGRRLLSLPRIASALAIAIALSASTLPFPLKHAIGPDMRADHTVEAHVGSPSSAPSKIQAAASTSVQPKPSSADTAASAASEDKSPRGPSPLGRSSTPALATPEPRLATADGQPQQRANGYGVGASAPTQRHADTALTRSQASASGASSASSMLTSVASSGEAHISIRPTLDAELARVVKQQSAALRAASAARHSPSVDHVTDKPAAPQSAAAPQHKGPAYALLARETRSRAASAILLSALEAEAKPQTNGPHAELLAVEGGWRAGLYPFSSREHAERVQRRLSASGLATQLIEF